ncbi:hypothetical protein P8452_53040 [Trifolium repens]|nr:hypothetical protein P8452_53040 [Trifolium repens]
MSQIPSFFGGRRSNVFDPFSIEDKNDQWHRLERSSGKFLRRFRLPENAKIDQVKANMENGVLTEIVPKEEVKMSED